MSMRGLAVLGLVLAGSVNGLSSWYTPPGGTPAGSVAGDKIRGVNLGGWFILENWMMPTFFEAQPLDQNWVGDEWSFCAQLGHTECLARLEKHWDTYVTEDDFKLFSNYSLNSIRIPMGYWSWTAPEAFEPYVQGQLPYLEKALNWSSYYGLDVMLDLHGLPGGQNGQDNQGLKGPIEFQNNGTNMDRAMEALANMTKFVTDPKWGGIVKAIELTNEPYILEYNPSGMDFNVLAEFYTKGYQVVRSSEYIAPGSHEVMVVIHDAFQPVLNWKYFWSEPSMGLNWTNYALDTHIYDAFGSAQQKSNQEHLDTICSLASNIQEAQKFFPVIVGEFSLGTTTYCVDYRSCFGQTMATISGSLAGKDTSDFLRQFWEVQADVYELGAGWIFWSFDHEMAAPWSWSQSAAQNWIPQDPAEKIWPFDATKSSYCLDTAHPLQGDQNLPAFPSFMSKIDVDTLVVVPKGNNSLVKAAASSSSSAAAAAAAASTSSISQTAPSTAMTSSSSTAAKSGAATRWSSSWGRLGLAVFIVTLAAI